MRQKQRTRGTLIIGAFAALNNAQHLAEKQKNVVGTQQHHDEHVVIAVMFGNTSQTPSSRQLPDIPAESSRTAWHVLVRAADNFLSHSSASVRNTYDSPRRFKRFRAPHL